MEARLGELMDDAVKTVLEVLGGTDIPPGVRLKAALSVVQFAARDELAGEAAALETWRNYELNPLRDLFG
jgi:hypothetical protein